MQWNNVKEGLPSTSDTTNESACITINRQNHNHFSFTLTTYYIEGAIDKNYFSCFSTIKTEVMYLKWHDMDL